MPAICRLGCHLPAPSIVDERYRTLGRTAAAAVKCKTQVIRSQTDVRASEMPLKSSNETPLGIPSSKAKLLLLYASKKSVFERSRTCERREQSLRIMRSLFALGRVRMQQIGSRPLGKVARVEVKGLFDALLSHRHLAL
jgi:hypothetical protein